MSEGTLVLVNPPKKRKVKKMATRRKSVKKARGTKASRSAAAKKAARTRKRNATKRSAAAKKAAATRKRNANKRKSSAKKAAATRKRKSPKRKATKRKAAKRTRGPSKAKRSAAAKKGWRTRKAKSTKRSNAAKRAARTRKGKTTRRKTKRKAAPKRRKSGGRMTKAKRSAAAKKGWRTRRRGGYKAKRKTTRRKTKRRKVSSAAATKSPGMMDWMPSTFNFKGFTGAASAFPGEFMNEAFGDLKSLSMAAVAGFSLMGTLAVAKGEVWDRIGVTAMVGDQLGSVHPDLANTFDAMLDLATLSVLGMALTKGLGVSPKWVTPGRQIAQVFVAADFVRNIEVLGLGDKATDLSGDIRTVLPSVSNITGIIPGISGIGLGSGGGGSNMNGPMFGTNNLAVGPSVGNNLALAMSPNNTAATGNTKFFGTQSLGSTRVNLF